MRPMLYGAEYEALIADRPEAEATITVAVAGKHCESGDILIKETGLPDPRPGDLLVTPCTGAYGYSMASNYNGQTRPAVVFVRDGQGPGSNQKRKLRRSGTPSGTTGIIV